MRLYVPHARGAKVDGVDSVTKPGSMVGAGVVMQAMEQLKPCLVLSEFDLNVRRIHPDAVVIPSGKSLPHFLE